MQFFKKGIDKTPAYPLDYIPAGTKLASPCIGNAHGFANPYDDNNIMTYLEEVSQVRADVKAGVYPEAFLAKYYPWGTMPSELPTALLNEGLSKRDPKGLADVVHMDNPMDLGVALCDWLRSKGVKPRHLSSNSIDFINAIPETNKKLADSILGALQKAFDIKYYYGMPRPEELHHEGKLLTSYPEGSPTHPAFPAGHGAAAGATAKTLIDHFDVTEEQAAEIRFAAYLWAQFRTFAGVHYALDNIAGLKVGGLEIEYMPVGKKVVGKQ